MVDVPALDYGVWVWPTALLVAITFVIALARIPWSIMLRERGLQHLFFGAILGLILLWMLRAGFSSGLTIHFLGMTTMTLLFGWDLAVCAGLIALTATTIFGRDPWTTYSVNGFCFVLIPVALTYSGWWLVTRFLPRNFFVYLLLCAFLGGGLSIALGSFSHGVLLWFAEVYSWEKIFDEYLRYLPLMMFPEGFINGTLMIGLMVYYPDWIRTFDARRYLDGQ